MANPSYVCVSCGEHFTRNTSARRHNFSIHNNNGYIVSWVEYLAGRSTNQYPVSSSHLPRRRPHNFQHAPMPITTVADSMGDSFRPGGLQTHRQPYYHQQQQQQQALPPTTHPAAPIHPTSQAPTQPNMARPGTSPAPTTPNSMLQYLRLRDQLLQSQPTNTTRKNEFGLSSESILKLAELKSRLYAHSHEFPHFDVIIQGARTLAMQGNTDFLDEQLAFFRGLDAMSQSSGQRS